MSSTKLRNYSNVAVISPLAFDITDSDDSLTITDPNGYPEAPFAIQIEAEVILVQSKSGINFNDLVRGFDDTSQTAHSAGAEIRHVVIADDLSYRWQDVVVTRPLGQYDDEFDDGSLSADWTQVTVTGTTTYTEDHGVLSILTSGQSSSDCNALLKGIGTLTPPVSLTMATRFFARANYLMFGPVFTDGTTSTSNVIWQMPYSSNNPAYTLSLRSGTMTNVATSYYTSAAGVNAPFLYQRLTWVTTNTWLAEWSPDGVSWTDCGQGNDSFTMTPTHMGIGISTWGSANEHIGTAEFFRVS